MLETKLEEWFTMATKRNDWFHLYEELEEMKYKLDSVFQERFIDLMNRMHEPKEGKSIFSISISEHSRYFENTSGLPVDSLIRAYALCEHPLDLACMGREMDGADYAYIEQSRDLLYSLNIDVTLGRLVIFNGCDEVHHFPLDQAVAQILLIKKRHEGGW